MAKSEGKNFSFESISSIDPTLLEAFTYGGGDQKIEIFFPEFSAVCPFSGLPDIGAVTMIYYPGDKCIELKSLKYYMITFRNVGIYQESALEKIFNDLFEVLSPKHLYVEIVYNIRGGMEVKNSKERGNIPAV